MKYRIEYIDGRHCDFADSRKDLIKKLQGDTGITDIRKVYKNGTTDSVMEIYKKYLREAQKPLFY